MRLTEAQREKYDREGFLIFPELFSPDEVAVLREEVARVSRIESQMHRPRGSRRTRQDHLPHATRKMARPRRRPVRAACRSPRALGVAQQLLGDDALYLHHCKVNVKAAIQGSAWPWHQDFGAWHLDGIAEPQLTTMAVMLDEATEFNGCLYLLPGSHQEGRQKPYWDESTAYKIWAVGPSDMRDMIARYPAPVPVTGKPGTAVFFHCNNFHASWHNLSAQDRCQMYFCFNRVANRPADVENPRPDYVRSRNWDPLPLGPDDGLLQCAAVPA